jgi:hypothetical protein
MTEFSHNDKPVVDVSDSRFEAVVKDAVKEKSKKLSKAETVVMRLAALRNALDESELDAPICPIGVTPEEYIEILKSDCSSCTCNPVIIFGFQIYINQYRK